MEARLRNVDELDRNIEAWTSQRTPHQVMKLMQSAGVPAGAVENSEDLYYDLQLRSIGHMIDVEVGRRGEMTFDGPPLRLAQGQKTGKSRAPFLGEHNDYVFRDLLGLTSEQVARLIADRVIY